MIENHFGCTAIHNKSAIQIHHSFIHTDSAMNLIRKEHSTDS